jgi:hypothetical protein
MCVGQERGQMSHISGEVLAEATFPHEAMR